MERAHTRRQRQRQAAPLVDVTLAVGESSSGARLARAVLFLEQKSPLKNVLYDVLRDVFHNGLYHFLYGVLRDVLRDVFSF